MNGRNASKTTLILTTAGLGAVLGMTALPLALAGGPPPQIQVPTTIDDFFQPGSQPLEDGMVPFTAASSNCINCHADYGSPPDPGATPLPFVDPPYDGWKASMMGQSARDPVWHAALAIANQDANDAGEYCIRCHSPGAWLQGRSLPADTSGFIETFAEDDFDGVQCHFCHRAVAPQLGPDSPVEDVDILADLDFPPPAGEPGNGRYVTDPTDVRRGPLFPPGSGMPDEIFQNLHFANEGGLIPIIQSPFHTKSDVCAACHDVGNPVYSRQPDGTYAPNAHGVASTDSVYDMFPEQRTYSEWLNSQFAQGGVLFTDGRFGGNHPTGLMESCQDCHMPDVFAGACFAWEFGGGWFARQDMPQHIFTGSNHWVLKAIRELYDDGDTGLSEDIVNASIERNKDTLRAASDTEVVQYGSDLKVRVVNYSGHKLPTGYPEGRRMWLNVQFYDATSTLIAEHGAYDLLTAELTHGDTKVYEAVHGIDSAVAAATNLPAGASNHLTLNNVVLFDNRIPPIGFTNAAYAAIRAEPVGQAYADGQHWDDTLYTIPAGAVQAVVTLNYQSMTKEYIEFLRDANVTTTDGQTIYDLWEDEIPGNPLGIDKAPPVDMDSVTIDLDPPLLGDLDGSGDVGFADILLVIGSWGPCPPPELCPEDLNCNGMVGFDDILIVIGNWG